MTQDTIPSSSAREQAIQYLLRQFSEIFDMNIQDQEVVRNNLESMDDNGLKNELELINGYYYAIQRSYTWWLSILRNMNEQQEKDVEWEVSFIA